MYPPMDPQEASRILSSVKGQEVRADDDELDLQPLDLQPVEQSLTDELLESYNKVFTPLWTGPSRGARYLTSLPDEGQAIAESLGVGTPYKTFRNINERGLEFAGDVASGLTSPGNLAMLIPTILSGGTARMGLEGLTKGLHLAGQVAAAPVAAKGAYDVVNPESTLTERGVGGLNTLLGGLVLGSKAPTVMRQRRPIFAKNVTPEAPLRLTEGGNRPIRVSDEPPLGNAPKELIEANQILSKPQIIFKDGRYIDKLTGEDVTDRFVSKTDPNFNQGEGNPELAGSVPYKNLDLDLRPLEAPVSISPEFVGSKRNKNLGMEDIEPEFQKIGSGKENLFYKSEGKGLGKISFEEQWKQSIKEAETLGIDYTKYDNLDELQWDITRETAIQTMKTGKNPLDNISDTEPQFARVGNKAQIGVNISRAAEELTSGYSSPLEGIMVREGLQNAFDVVKPLGIKGKASIKIEETGLEISDNGRGMSPDELFTVYTNLHESGKTADISATGGKGVGKAPYMLGGSNFEVRTVKEIGGKKIESSFKGTPEELMQPFDIVSREVPKETPTGTWFRTDFKSGQERYRATSMLDSILENSRGLENELDIDNYSNRGINKIKSFQDDKLMADEMIGNNKSQIYVPHDAQLGNRFTIDVRYLNNGMYQFRETLYLDEATNGIPNKVIVNIEPKVPEGHADYPFPVQRESIKEGLKNSIDKLIKDKLVNPLANKRKVDLIKLWNSMEVVKTAKAGGRDTVFYDPGDRLTAIEKQEFTKNVFVQYLTDSVDNIINEILVSSGNEAWRKKVVRVGLTLDPNMYGVHIPNPHNPKLESAIFVNPFQHFIDKSPADASLDMVTTSLHEVAHVGSEKGNYTPLETADLNDPRVGRFLQSYLKETIQQGGLDMGHGMPFIHRLGEIYGRYGTRNALNAATKIQRSITSETGNYSPAIQRLLSIYSESRGRPATTEDILSGTGIKQANRGRTREGIIPSDDSTVRNGIFRRFLSDESGSTRGAGESSTLREVWNLTRGILSTDLPYLTSASLRQGKGHIGTAKWWKAWVPSFKAYGSEVAFKAHDLSLRSKPIFRASIQVEPEKISKTGQPIEAKYDSPIKLAGVRLIELGKGLNKDESAIRSELAEKIPVFGILNKASNRQFAAYLNDLRVNSFEELYNYAAEQGLFPNKNLPLLKEIGDYVNNSTGSGGLKTRVPFRDKEFSLEKQASALAEVFFSPRLTAANLHSFNPYNYFGTSPMVRKQYWKSAALMAGSWMTFASLAKMAGADVVLDPTSADFGKIKIGNTRIDPPGGLQQFIVLAARQATGKFTSSTSGKTVEMGSNLLAPTRFDVMENFAVNKLHPSANFLVDFARATKRQPFQGADRVLQASTPMIIQDLTEIINEGDPRMLMLTPLISAGWGTQTYDKGPREGLFISKDKDISFQGGSFLGGNDSEGLTIRE